ncbi:MAG: hypothetical protein GX897_06010 [Clostridiales bacterium]|nr:hypothetical protein [Clostridiales bacterium]
MQRKTTIRVTAIFILFIMLLSSFLGCGKEDATPESKEIMTEADETTTAEVTKEPFDEIQEADFGSYNFRVLTLSAGINATNRFTQEIWVEAETGDVINDAIFRRNSMIADRLGVNIIACPVDDVFSAATKSAMSGSDDYDLHGMYTKFAAITIASEGLVRDWNKIPGLNLDTVYWNSNCRDNLSVCGKLYLMSGAILISEIDDTLAMIYNKKLAEDNGLESIYTLVFDGKWTLDTFAEQATAIYTDIDGDGVMKPKNDLFGYIQDPASMTNNWLFSCDLLGEKILDDGVIDMNMDQNRIQTTLEKLAKVNSSDGIQIGLDLYEGLDYFKEDRIYIYAIILRNIELLRDMESDFGIIPYPKFDENQPDYLNHVGGSSPILTVPITNTSDDERLRQVLEGMAAASYQVVLPAYFDVALKEKYSRDKETQDMLDIILKSRTYNLGYLGSISFVWDVAALIKGGKTDFSSYWAKSESSMTKKYQKVIDKLLEIED